jgi:MFS family permease
VHKLSTLMSGVMLTPRSVGVIVASVVTSFMLKRWGYRRPIVAGVVIASLATFLLTPALPLWREGTFIHEVLPFLILACGIGAGTANPAANNACIELMPDKVATITGLRGMFRSVGAALGISLVTLILHLSPDPFAGFTITFIFFGIALLCVIPLVSLMPAGKREWA